MKELVPDPHLIDSYINADKDWADGCLEFIDNAFAPDAGNASKISFRFEKDRILIWDNGQGVEDLNALFRLGHSHSQFSREDLGFFGVGAKAAALWMGKKVTIHTIRNGVYHVHSVDWAKARNKKRWPKGYSGTGEAADQVALPEQLSNGRGTLIEIEGRWPGRRRLFLDPFCETLQQRCAPGLRSGKQIEVYREAQFESFRSLRAFQPTDLTDTQEFWGEIDGMGYRCRVGCMHDYNAKWTGLWIGWGHRIVTIERRPFERSIPPRFYGEVDLSPEWKPCLTTFKNDIARHKEALFADIYAKCKGLIDLVEEYQQDLRLDVISRDLSSHLTKILTGGHESGGTHGRNEGKQKGKGTGRANGNSEPGDREPEERKRRTGGVSVRWRDDLGPHVYRVDDVADQLLIELNGKIDYVATVRDRPINTSATWALIASAIAQHVGNKGPDASKKLLPKLAEAFKEEWTDGNVNESLLFRQVFSFLIANVPDYKEPTLRAFDRNNGID